MYTRSSSYQIRRKYLPESGKAESYVCAKLFKQVKIRVEKTRQLYRLYARLKEIRAMSPRTWPGPEACKVVELGRGLSESWIYDPENEQSQSLWMLFPEVGGSE